MNPSWDRSSRLFRMSKKPRLAAGVLEFPFYWFYIGAPAIKGSAFSAQLPAASWDQSRIKDFGAQVTIGLPVLSEREKQRRGRSTQSGVTVSSYWRQNAFDLYLHAVQRISVSDPLPRRRPNKTDRYPQLPDTSVTNVGMNWYFVTRPRVTRLRAAFDQNEFQLASGGSWIINPFFNHLEMFLGSSSSPHGFGGDFFAKFGV